MNTTFKYDNFTVSVISTNNKVEKQDKKQIIKFGEKFFISIEGSTVEKVKMEKELQEFMQSGIFYPLLIRAFFSSTILTWDEFLKISENENAKDVFDIFMDIVVSFKKNFKNLDLSTNEKIISFSNILDTIFPNEDYDFGEIFPQNKNTESVLLIWNEIQDMLHNVFEAFYSCFSEVVKDNFAADFKCGTCEDYLNLIINHQTINIGFFKSCYEQIINKSLHICFDNYDNIDIESSEFRNEIKDYEKFLDEDYSDIWIYTNFLPNLIKKVRHISSGDAVKDVEEKEISDLKICLQSLLYPQSDDSIKILNHCLWISIEGALNDDLNDFHMLDIFLKNSNCKVEDWSDKQYYDYTLEKFNPVFKEYKHKISNRILNNNFNLVYCPNGLKYGDCTHATSGKHICPFLHCDGFRLPFREKYVVLTKNQKNDTDGEIFYNKEISEKIFEAVRTNFPEHDKIYQFCENGKNTLYLFSGRIGKYTYVYTVPPRESEVVDCPSEITCNDSSENDNSLDNSFNQLSSETHQESVNSTSGNQEVEKSTSSSKGYSISFFTDEDDSEDEDNTCESVQIDNVWKTSERLQTIVDDEERKKKIHPKKEKVKKNYNSGKVVTKDISFLSVVSNSNKNSTSSGVSSSSVVPSDKENAKDFQSLEASNDIPKNVEKSLPNLNPCSHYLSKGVCRYNEKCKFDHVTFCEQFITYGLCNDNCGNYHPEELKKLIEKYRYVSRTLGQSGDFYGYWKKLYIPEICRAKYVNDCKYKNCRRFHYKSTK